MFIYNFKINGSKVFKFIFIGMVIILLLVLVAVGLKIFKGSLENKNINDTESGCISSNAINKISSKNYSNILKAVHEDIDSYIGTKINFSGYVYRVYDLEENQFILARNMIISSDYKSVVIGFLCEYDQIKDFENDTWIEITGTIKKGTYHSDMPIVEITDIKKVDTPTDEYVYPPDESYIPTDGLV